MMKYSAMAAALAGALAAPMSFAQTSSGEVTEQAPASAVLESKDLQGMKDLKHIRVSKLVGANVASKDGDNLGQVQDLILDPNTGEIRFALVSKGFMAGLGHDMIPVPWQAINLRSEREFALSVDKEKLRSAPDWSQTEMEQPDYIIRIYRFYELEPQTDTGGTGASGTETGEARGGSEDVNNPGSSPESQTLPNHSSEATDEGDLAPENR